MGQHHSLEEWRELFDRLDANNTGQLTLRKIFAADIPLVAPCSIAYLFRFDESMEGALNFEEFSELLCHIRKLQSKPKKSMFSFRRIKRRPQSHNVVCRKTLDARSASDYQLDRNSMTPSFVGRSHEIEVVAHGEDEEDDAIHQRAIEEDKCETFQILEQKLRKPEGRRAFKEWLWNVADMDETGRVTLGDLELLMRAVSNDHINVTELSFDESSKSYLESIMAEFDVDCKGYLSRPQFLLLADLITKNYEEIVHEFATRTVVGNYILKWKLGEGSVGIVRLAEHKMTKKKVAIKIVPKGDQCDLARLDNEVRAMLMLNHPNVVHLKEILETEDTTYLVMELCGGGSIAELVSVNPLSEDLARYYFHQLACVVDYCHKQGVVHRDLKLENLLLDNHGVVHVSDFGHVGIFSKGWDVFTTAVGSLFHLSPEQIEGEPYSGEKTDTWAMGVLLYIMLTGTPPFFSPNISKLLEDIKNVNFQCPEYISDEASDLIHRILKYDRSDRPSMEEILAHPWLAHYSPTDPSIILRPLKKTRAQVNWNQIIDVLHDLDVVVVNTRDSLHSSNCYEIIKCHYPAKELNFSLALIIDSSIIQVENTKIMVTHDSPSRSRSKTRKKSSSKKTQTSSHSRSSSRKRHKSSKSRSKSKSRRSRENIFSTSSDTIPSEQTAADSQSSDEGSHLVKFHKRKPSRTRHIEEESTILPMEGFVALEIKLCKGNVRELNKLVGKLVKRCSKPKSND